MFPDSSDTCLCTNLEQSPSAVITWKVKMLATQSCPTFCNPTDCSLPGSSVHGILQAGVGCHSLLPGVFPTQGSNPGLQHCRQILNCWTTKEVPKGLFVIFKLVCLKSLRQLCVLVSESCPTLCDPIDCCLPGSSVHRILHAGILDCNSLLQGIFPTQGSNPGLLHCRQILYHLSYQGSPYMYCY